MRSTAPSPGFIRGGPPACRHHWLIETPAWHAQPGRVPAVRRNEALSERRPGHPAGPGAPACGPLVAHDAVGCHPPNVGRCHVAALVSSRNARVDAGF